MKLVMRMSVETHEVKVKSTKFDSKLKEMDRSSLVISMAPSAPGNTRRQQGSGRIMDLEMTFQANEPPKVPEMVRRLQEWYTDIVRPLSPEEADRY